MKISNFCFQFLRSVICSCALIVCCGESKNVKANVPKEILDLFNSVDHADGVKNETFPPGSVNNGNQFLPKDSSSNVKEQFNRTVNGGIEKQRSTTPVTQEMIPGSKSETQPLNVTILDFTSSSDESSHSNKTSSIKPRKGVHLSKIVPKKGVNFEDFVSSSIPVDHSCFIVNQTNCYDMDYYKNLVCNCCEISNELGKMIGYQPLVNCSNCTPVNKLSFDLSQPCSGICCVNITLSTTLKPTTVNTNITSRKNSTKYGSSNELLNKPNRKINIKKQLKPSVTNVPYDSDISNSFNKSKGEKYVPIIVSIFVLPLAGILIFFTWRKTRELWERRYYRRMDFLIDGMYNE